MLIRQLSNISGIRPKELLVTPTGLLCYLIDCINQGFSMEDAICKANCYELSALSMQEVLYNRKLLKRIEHINLNLRSIKELLEK